MDDPVETVEETVKDDDRRSPPPMPRRCRSVQEFDVPTEDDFCRRTGSEELFKEVYKFRGD